MNKHLKPIFEIFLPDLIEAQIDYWVFGGVSVAAYTGKFLRFNKDVDIFIKEAGMDNALSILESRCYDQDFVWNKCRPLRADGFSRPKLEVKKGPNEILSIVPVFLETNQAALVFGNGVKKYPMEILERIKREVSGNVFYTLLIRI